MAKRKRSPKPDGRTSKRRRPSQNRESEEQGVSSKISRVKSSVSPLSHCPSPMIHPFEDQEASIEWEKSLDTHFYKKKRSFVFKVKINSKPYVLKVFKFYDPSATKWAWERALGEDYPIEKAIYYTDPFYAECRAYGRIKEAVEKGEIRGKIATKCHGYLFLNTDAQRWLKDNGFDLGARDLPDDMLAIQGGFGRPRAILKDFEIKGPGLAEQTPQQIRRSFWSVRQLNLLGIYNRDVRAEKFRNGWLVDFGVSCTTPHDVYDSLPSSEAHTIKTKDLVGFEDMLEEAGVKMRFLRTKYYNFRPRRKQNI